MICVNEWESPDWITLEWGAIPPEAGKAPKPPPAAAKRLPNLVDAIGAALSTLQPSPSDVHFYMGEGLCWIRVGFAAVTLQPAAVGEIGSVIAGCLPRQVKLYFHALRPRDVLFFLEGGRADKVGMPAESFGVALEKVLQAWTLTGRPTKPKKMKA